jgi:hypothetical protein
MAEAEANAPKGITFTPGTKIDANAPLPTGDTEAGPPSTTTTKPVEPGEDKPPVVKPPVMQPNPKPETPVEKPDGGKRKGKKGDG